MIKRRKIMLAFASVLILGILIAVIYAPQPKTYYNGRNLSEWVQRCQASNFDERFEAEKAVRHIGTNAIPYLLSCLRYEPSASRSNLNFDASKFLQWVNPKWRLPDKKQIRSEYAFRAFVILGPDRKAAIPGLTSILNDPKAKYSARRAVHVLGYCGKDALPSLMLALTNQDASVRVTALFGVMQLEQHAKPAVPLLIQCLGDKQDGVARQAAYVLGKLQLQPDLVVPALTNCLQHANSEVRGCAAQSLGEFNTKARFAVPALLNLLNDAIPSERALVTTALLKIDPEALKRATNGLSP